MVTHNKGNQFTGYLGNRMFQAAAAIGVATKNGMNYDFTENEHWSNFGNMRHTLNRNLSFVNLPESGFGYEDVTLRQDRNYNLLGYRQSEKYFSHCRDLIVNTFKFKDEAEGSATFRLNELKKMAADAMGNHNTKRREKRGQPHKHKPVVSLHVRLGDYTKLKEHHTCLMDTGYYTKACEEFPNAAFVVFSDDISLELMFKLKADNPGRHFVSAGIFGSAAENMCLMSKMDGHIIANSTFSWWAAWLSGKKTVAPHEDKWFGPAYKDMHTGDLIPDSFKQISF